ncbi:hypothetical protein QIS99_05140 [Streptomyces sp. B-S-A8]|uniref:Uncharacterized protein n=1 Tax=Streptomyces solicavernae TaxID=3043614 RepID=A0ABT6RMF5_9ACTN|nr:hypothetical protein [Streptomyces sp. B-S-A8]MDI3385603.1 hypothetical protein [Streptomyces sp. B-S-A8]
MSLVELIAQADGRSLAAGGLGCLDRCLPLLGEADDEVLRPLWSSLDAGGAGWGEELARVRAAYGTPQDGSDGDASDRDASDGDASDGDASDGGAALVHRMLSAAPDRFPGPDLRTWADACSAASLQIHRLLDATGPADADGPLTTGELRRQTRILDLLATPAGGLRQALAVSTEGRRVVRAAVSRRARVRG